MQVWRKLLEDVSGQINADLNSELLAAPAAVRLSGT